MENNDYDKNVNEYLHKSVNFNKIITKKCIFYITSILKNLFILIQLPQFKTSKNEKILQLIVKLHEINKKKVSSNCTSSIHSNSNILLLFYSNKCEQSVLFFNEWKKIKKIFGNKYKILAINCNNKKYNTLCKKFNIFQYPTIKYIENNTIHEYFGDLTSDQIIKTFNL